MRRSPCTTATLSGKTYALRRKKLIGESSVRYASRAAGSVVKMTDMGNSCSVRVWIAPAVLFVLGVTRIRVALSDVRRWWRRSGASAGHPGAGRPTVGDRGGSWRGDGLGGFRPTDSPPDARVPARRRHKRRRRRKAPRRAHHADAPWLGRSCLRTPDSQEAHAGQHALAKRRSGLERTQR